VNMLSLFAVLVALQASTLVSAQEVGWSGYVPLASRIVPYDQIPYRIDNDASGRGPQAGYNLCNATTEGPESRCQTGFVNSLEDFCLWGLPEPGQTVGDSEAEAVAYCTLPGHGTRVIPPGAVYAAQFIQTETYIQVTGRMDQTQFDIQAGDYGGEMDPIGADQRGNPLGGLMYSTAFQGNSTRNNTLPTQIRYWTNFMGSDTFCIKLCDPNDPLGPRQCEHIYDRIGCAYNMPASYTNQTFESCEGDLGLLPGVYRQNGQTLTYTQPPESLGVITTIPYVAEIPPTSNCASPTSAPAAFLIPGRSVSSEVSSAASSAVSSAAPGSITGSASTGRVLAASSITRSFSSAGTSGASTLVMSSLAGLVTVALVSIIML